MDFDKIVTGKLLVSHEISITPDRMSGVIYFEDLILLLSLLQLNVWLNTNAAQSYL